MLVRLGTSTCSMGSGPLEDQLDGRALLGLTIAVGGLVDDVPLFDLLVGDGRAVLDLKTGGFKRLLRLVLRVIDHVGDGDHLAVAKQPAREDRNGGDDGDDSDHGSGDLAAVGLLGSS